MITIARFKFGKSMLYFLEIPPLCLIGAGGVEGAKALGATCSFGHMDAAWFYLTLEWNEM